LLALLFTVYGRVWQYILGRFGYEIGFARSMRVWFLSQAGRYIPGKVWFTLGRIYLCQREGVPKGVAVVATGLELVLVLGSAIVMFGLASWLSPLLAGGPYVVGLWLVPVILAGMHPKFIQAVLRRLRKVPIHLQMRYVEVLGLLGVYLLCWVLYGVGFYLVGTSLIVGRAAPDFGMHAASETVPAMIGINSLSWAGGFLSVVTPAGLGIREGISSILLGDMMQAPYPYLIPLAARIWVTVAEVGTIGALMITRGVK
jgi:type IV secretory pathway TrbD component